MIGISSQKKKKTTTTTKGGNHDDNLNLLEKLLNVHWTKWEVVTIKNSSKSIEKDHFGVFDNKTDAKFKSRPKIE